MPIPELSDLGFLPAGVHTCTLDEVKDRFGSFRGSDGRIKLFTALNELIAESRRTGLFVAIVIDGSFVTNAVTPNDIDLILLLKREHDWQRDPAMHEYNVLSRRRLRKRFGFDAFIAIDGNAVYAELVEFFGRVRDTPNVSKGMLRIEL